MVTRKIPSVFWGIEKDTWYRKIFLLLRYQRFFQRFFCSEIFLQRFFGFKDFSSKIYLACFSMFCQRFSSEIFCSKIFLQRFCMKYLFGRNWNLKVIDTNTTYVARNDIYYTFNPSYGKQHFIQGWALYALQRNGNYNK